MPRKKSPVTRPGIDPGPFWLVALPQAHTGIQVPNIKGLIVCTRTTKDKPRILRSVYRRNGKVTMRMCSTLVLNTIAVSRTSFASDFLPLQCQSSVLIFLGYSVTWSSYPAPKTSRGVPTVFIIALLMTSKRSRMGLLKPLIFHIHGKRIYSAFTTK
jgi:hypothetical protein